MSISLGSLKIGIDILSYKIRLLQVRTYQLKRLTAYKNTAISPQANLLGHFDLKRQLII